MRVGQNMEELAKTVRELTKTVWELAKTVWELTKTVWEFAKTAFHSLAVFNVALKILRQTPNAVTRACRNEL